MTPEQFVALGDIIAGHFERFAAQLDLTATYDAHGKVAESLRLTAISARESAGQMRKIHRNLMEEES